MSNLLTNLSVTNNCEYIDGMEYLLASQELFNIKNLPLRIWLCGWNMLMHPLEVKKRRALTLFSIKPK